MKRIAFISLAIITVLAWSFIVIGITSMMNSCNQPQTESKPDSLTKCLDGLHQCLALNDSLQLHIQAWKNIVSINHVNLDRQQESMRDLAAELDAEREQVKKWRTRLDSAISIIRRQEVQLRNCIYSKP